MKGVGRCTTSTILFALGGQAGPAFYHPLEVVQTWFELWAATTDTEKATVRRVWGALNLKLRRLANRKWVCVRGLMSSVIAVLQDLGWKAPRPDLWLSPEGDTYVGHGFRLGARGFLAGLQEDS